MRLISLSVSQFILFHYSHSVHEKNEKGEKLLDNEPFNHAVGQWFQYRQRMNDLKCDVADHDREICDDPGHQEPLTRSICFHRGCCYDHVGKICYKQKTLSISNIDLFFTVKSVDNNNGIVIETKKINKDEPIATFHVPCTYELRGRMCIPTDTVTHFRFESSHYQLPQDYVNDRPPRVGNPFSRMEIALVRDEDDIQFTIRAHDYEHETCSYQGKVGDRDVNIVNPASHHVGRRLMFQSLETLESEIKHTREKFQGWENANRFGRTIDCLEGVGKDNPNRCPQYFGDECWKNKIKELEAQKRFGEAVDVIEILALNVFVFLDKSYCEQFDSLQECIDGVYGLFNSMNEILIYQLHFHFQIGFIATSEIIENDFPQMALYKLRDQATKDAWIAEENRNGNDVVQGRNLQWAFLVTMSRYLGKGACDTNLRHITGGMGIEDFAFFHMIHRVLDLSQNHVERGKHLLKQFTDGLQGLASPRDMCTCGARGISRIHRNAADDGLSPSWTTLIHELCHNMGAKHTFDRLGYEKKNAAGGVMDYGDAKSHNIYQLSDYHKNEICPTVRDRLVDYWGNDKHKCFTPFYQNNHKDPRQFNSDTNMLIWLFSLGFLLLFSWFFCLSLCFQCRKLRNQKKELAYQDSRLRSHVRIINCQVQRHNLLVDQMHSLRDEIFSRSEELENDTELALDTEEKRFEFERKLIELEVKYKEKIEMSIELECVVRLTRVFENWKLRYGNATAEKKSEMIQDPEKSARAIFDEEFFEPRASVTNEKRRVY